MGNCVLTYILLGLLLLVLIYSYTPTKSNFAALSDVDLSTRTTHRVCRCVPQRHRAVMGDKWGVPVRCPNETLWKGMELWCTSDSESCVLEACNSVNF